MTLGLSSKAHLWARVVGGISVCNLSIAPRWTGDKGLETEDKLERHFQSSVRSLDECYRESWLLLLASWASRPGADNVVLGWWLHHSDLCLHLPLCVCLLLFCLI